MLKHASCLQLIIFSAVWLLLGHSWLNAASPSLSFSLTDQKSKTLTLEKMKASLKSHSIRFYNPHCDKQKTYAAFKIHDVLTLGFDKEWQNDAYSDITFTALDGYKAVARLSRMNEPNGYLAYQDLDGDGWEKVGRKMADPGPFYLVWTGKDQTTANEFPWPWQLASISLLRFKDQYPEVYPEGVDKHSPVFHGYTIFKGRCFRCHAMNQQGGKIGPDLNAPQGITSYRSHQMIKAFIKKPSAFRYTTMPDHPDLNDNDLDALLDYFKFKNPARQKNSDSTDP